MGFGAQERVRKTEMPKLLLCCGLKKTGEPSSFNRCINKENSCDRGPKELLYKHELYGDDFWAATFECLTSISNLTCTKQDSWFPLTPQHISFPAFSTSVNGIPPPIQKPRTYSLSVSFPYFPHLIRLQVLSTPLQKYTLNPLTSLHFHYSLSSHHHLRPIPLKEHLNWPPYLHSCANKPSGYHFRVFALVNPSESYFPLIYT